MRIIFRDLLAVLFVVLILAFWILQGMGLLIKVPGEVNGALIAAFALIAQYYFRQRPREEERE